MKVIITEDDIRDIAINIVDLFVGCGLIEDCTDTDDTTEFDFQDQINDIITERLNQLKQTNELE